MVRRRRSSVGVLGVFLVVLLAWQGAAAEPLRLRYEVWGGGFHLLSFGLAIDETGTAYRIVGDFRSRGLADALLGFVMRAETEGGIGNAGLAPRRYVTTSELRGTPRRTEIDYLPNGEVIASASPPESAERTPVPATLLRGVLDPLSAVLDMARSLAAGGDCNRRVPVFDGRRRYDLVFTDRGFAELKPSRWAVYAGPARACRVRQVRLGGFLKERRQNDVSEEASIWIASVLPDAPPVPVRLEFDSGWGWVLIHLVEATSAAGARRLPVE